MVQTVSAQITCLIYLWEPRGCYKQAFKEGLINDIEIWNDILLSRNSTSHIYDEQDYEKIKNKIVSDYTDAIENLLCNLSKVVM